MSNTVLVLLLSTPPLLMALVLMVMAFTRKNRERRACDALLGHIKAAEEEHKQALERYLRESLHIEKNQAQVKTTEMLKLRKHFFRKLLTGFLNRDVALTAELDSELSTLTNAYHLLEPAQAPPVTPVSEAPRPSADAVLVTRLQEENQRLRQEVTITMGTLNNIFAEYSSMFGSATPETELSVDQILERMQTMAMSDQSDDDDDSGKPMSAEEIDLLTSTAPEPEPDSEAVMTVESLMQEPVITASEDIDPSWEDAFAEAAKTGDGKA